MPSLKEWIVCSAYRRWIRPFSSGTGWPLQSAWAIVTVASAPFSLETWAECWYSRISTERSKVCAASASGLTIPPKVMMSMTVNPISSSCSIAEKSWTLLMQLNKHTGIPIIPSQEHCRDHILPAPLPASCSPNKNDYITYMPNFTIVKNCHFKMAVFTMYSLVNFFYSFPIAINP